jgi:hypothetical protein
MSRKRRYMTRFAAWIVRELIIALAGHLNATSTEIRRFRADFSLKTQ